MSLKRALLPVLLVAAATSACKKSTPPNVAATVNSRPITFADLDKQYQSQFGATAAGASEDQVTIQKLEILRSLVDGEIMLQRAEKQNLMATDSEVETRYNELKAPYTKEEFDRQLQARKMTVEDLKAQLRKDLSIQKLFNKEITSRINITDKDISEFYNSNKASFNLPEPQVHLGQILVTPAPDPNVRNLKADKAQTDDQARKKIEMILARIRSGEDFTQIAQNYSEDPNTAPNGGDLGYIGESQLERANAELKKAIMTLAAGQTTGIIKTSEGYRILKVISKEPSGQRELTDPKVQESIREQLRNRKDQLLKAAYYEVARNEAKVENFFAERVVARDNK
jgi:peptidyl-prolyl cis-trans isomerase SurA